MSASKKMKVVPLDSTSSQHPIPVSRVVSIDEKGSIFVKSHIHNDVIINVTPLIEWIASVQHQFSGTDGSRAAAEHVLECIDTMTQHCSGADFPSQLEAFHRYKQMNELVHVFNRMARPNDYEVDLEYNF